MKIIFFSSIEAKRSSKSAWLLLFYGLFHLIMPVFPGIFYNIKGKIAREIPAVYPPFSHHAQSLQTG
jgi:hypothetical protein